MQENVFAFYDYLPNWAQNIFTITTLAGVCYISYLAMRGKDATKTNSCVTMVEKESGSSDS
jgi:hypothetical protein